MAAAEGEGSKRSLEQADEYAPDIKRGPGNQGVRYMVTIDDSEEKTVVLFTDGPWAVVRAVRGMDVYYGGKCLLKEANRLPNNTCVFSTRENRLAAASRTEGIVRMVDTTGHVVPYVLPTRGVVAVGVAPVGFVAVCKGVRPADPFFLCYRHDEPYVALHVYPRLREVPIAVACDGEVVFELLSVDAKALNDEDEELVRNLKMDTPEEAERAWNEVMQRRGADARPVLRQRTFLLAAPPDNAVPAAEDMELTACDTPHSLSAGPGYVVVHSYSGQQLIHAFLNNGKELNFLAAVDLCVLPTGRVVALFVEPPHVMDFGANDDGSFDYHRAGFHHQLVMPVKEPDAMDDDDAGTPVVPAKEPDAMDDDDPGTPVVVFPRCLYPDPEGEPYFYAHYSELLHRRIRFTAEDDAPAEPAA
jgi:hypothetical protein